ncbi:YraN family protein [Bombiscardovia coagulans]|uniref:UPF0102 protein BOCO_0571 n=1 Tax=Bombiscardovia coagulans TaxID=686666 RepID=A0A261ET59_9BIFI|nr:YraN family protein [Bombiscardovia coagulans]OZG50054.1 endonuclease [Bombiscardovia coagulans]
MKISNTITDSTCSLNNGLRLAESRLLSPNLTARTLGSLGEEYVAQWLQTLGWQIVDRNWSTRYGELDIVALDQRNCLVFVEVKTRRTTQFGRPEEAVAPNKQIHLKHAASLWLMKQHNNRNIRHQNIRFDVAAVSVCSNDTHPTVSIKLIQGAF